MQALHNHLVGRIRPYRIWHQTETHHFIHWSVFSFGVLALFFMLVGAIISFNSDLDELSFFKGIFPQTRAAGPLFQLDISSSSVTYSGSDGSGNCTLVGNAAIVESPVGSGTYAVDLDGNGDATRCGTGVDHLTNLTVMLWVDQDTAASTSQFVNKGPTGSGTHSWSFRATTGSTLQIAAQNSSSLTSNEVDQFTLPSDAWDANVGNTGTYTHIAATMEGCTSMACSSGQIYVNGTPQTTTMDSDVTGTIRDDAGYALQIGCLRTGVNPINCLDGRVKGVKIYSPVLTSAEVASVYNSENTGGSGGGDLTPPTLSAGSPSGVLSSGTTQATLSFSTNEAASCKYSTTANTAYASMANTFSTTGATSHSSTVTGLINGNTYTYYVRCIDGSGNASTSDFTISFSVASGSSSDLTPPTISVTSPSAGSSLSGTAAVSASASDNIGVVGVQFKLDGSNLSSEDTISPYTISWDTTAASNGSHTLTATARDAAGNSTTSSGTTITVSNGVVAPGPGQALQVTADTGTYDPPNTAPFTSLGSRRIEMRANLTNLSCSTSATLWQLGGLSILCSSANADQIFVGNPSGGNSFSGLSKVGLSDVFIRVQFDPNGEIGRPGYAWLEMWDATTGAYLGRRNRSGAAGASNDASIVQNVLGNKTFDIAWVRQHSTLVQQGTGNIENSTATGVRDNRAIPKNTAEVADLGSWEFEGNLNDSSPFNMTLSAVGTSFISSATLNPIPIVEKVGQPLWMPDPVCRSGNTCTLTAARSISGHSTNNSLTYLWSHVSGPATAIFTSNNTEEVNVALPVFGDYTLRLQITDQNSNSKIIDFHVGAVATDNNGIVSYPDSRYRLLAGDNIIMGASPWPALDKNWIDMAEFYGAKVSGAIDASDMHDFFNDARPGLVSVTNGSTQVACSQPGSCNFQTTFCNGGTNKVSNNIRLIVWSQDGGRKEQVLANTNACPNQDTLNLQYSYTDTANAQTLQYSAWGDGGYGGLGYWIGDSDNPNYYDVVLGFYSAWLRTGLDKYKDFARELAGRWWTMPRIDRGNCMDNNSGGNTGCQFAGGGGGGNHIKSRALTGLMLWALETGTESSVWPGITRMIQEYKDPTHSSAFHAKVDTTFKIRDFRLDGYALLHLTLCGILNPNLSERQSCKDAVNFGLGSTGRWGAYQEPLFKAAGSSTDGAWLSGWTGGVGGMTITLTQGSDRATLSADCGTTCIPSQSNPSPWVCIYDPSTFASDSSARLASTVAHKIASYSFPEIIFETPWQGPSSSTMKIHAVSSSIGCGGGIQAYFTMGPVAMWAANLDGFNTSGAQRLKEYAKFYTNSVYSPVTHGVYYSRGNPAIESGDGGSHPECPTTGVPFCGPGDPHDRRLLGLEGLRFLGHALELTRNNDQTLYNKILAQGDDILAYSYNNMFGTSMNGPGGADGNWLLEMENATALNSTGTSDKAKDFGFAYGLGGIGTYLAQRVGGPIGGGGADITPPSVSITSPSASATVSGTINITANASDNIGVSGVQFKLDGSNLSFEDTFAPYSVSWDTTTASNGSHTLTAVARDAAGNTATSAGVGVTVSNVVDSTPPTISNTAVGGITQTSATISWSTNEIATSQVQYGQTTSYGSQSPLDSSLVANHSVTLSGLSSGTTYNYRVKSADSANNEATGINRTFTTVAAPDTTPPAAVSNLASSGLGQTFIDLSWTAPGDDGTSGTASFYDVRYTTGVMNDANFASASQATGEPNPAAAGSSQGYILVGLTPGTAYQVAIKARDEANNVSGLSNILSITTNAASVPDPAPPVIGSLAVTAISQTSATITWTTDEPASSQVLYGLSSSLGLSTSLNASLTLSHSVTLSGLTANTTYHYRARSTDGSNNTDESSTLTFTTAQIPDGNAPSITAVATSNITNNSATITWTTNEPASSLIQYSLVATLGFETTEANVTSRVTDHSITLSSLIPCSHYRLRVRSRDASNNVSFGAPTTFFTLGCLGDAEILDHAAKLIDLAASDALSLTADSRTILTIATPATFASNVSTAFLHAKRLSRSPVIVAAGKPANREFATTHMYDLTILPSPTSTVASFSKPLTLTMHYTDQEIAGLQENTLVIFRYTGTAWQQATGCSRDTGLNQVTCTTQNFSVFALAGTPDGTSGSPSTGSGGSGGGGGGVSDSTPPPQVENPLAEGADSQIAFSWTNPDSSDYVRTIIVRSTSTAPATVHDGIIVYEGTDELFTDVNVDNTTIYFYAIFTIDRVPNYSAPIHIEISPVEGKTQTTIIPPSQTPALTAIRLVKYLNNPTVYVIENGSKRAIPSLAILRNRYGNLPIITIEDTETYPDGAVLNFGPGALLKSADNPSVWLIIDDNSRYGFKSAEEFFRFGYRFDLVTTIIQQELDTYPISGIQTLRYHAHSNFIKYADNSTVYRIENNTKRAIPTPAVFFAYADSWNKVLISAPDITYQDAAGLDFPEGYLIKGASPEVYIIENNQRRAFRSGETFINRGYSFSQIIEVPDTELGLHTLGEEVE